jgi:hypothetical protein
MTKHHALARILRPSRAGMVNDEFPPARRYGFELVDAQNSTIGATIRHQSKISENRTCRFFHDFSAN